MLQLEEMLSLALSPGLLLWSGTSHMGDSRSVVSATEALASVAHGLAQFSVVFMVGLAGFVFFVWLPACRAGDLSPEDGSELLCRAVWILAGLLVFAGMVDLPVYAVRASGESLSFGLLSDALFETKVGHLWTVRVALGLATACVVTGAIRSPTAARWLGSASLGGALAFTLTYGSHAVSAGGVVPMVADWLHVAAASVWMGGLLGFPLMLVGPLRKMPSEGRAGLLGKAVRRFTRFAAVAVVALVVTGSYAALIHIPSLDALLGTPYGRALIMKLGLLAVMLFIGAINMLDRGEEGPFGRMVNAEMFLAFGVFVATGFLSTLPPPG